MLRYIKAMQPSLDNIKVQSTERILLIWNGALEEEKKKKIWILFHPSTGKYGCFI